MKQVPREGMSLYYDTESGGYWLERDQLATLAARHDSLLDSVEVGPQIETHTGRYCPKDGAELVMLEFGDHSGIKVDHCPTCGGLWLDGGELPGIIAYMDSHPFGADIPNREDDISISDRLMLFLYQLTARPPYV